jgi:hypothetical protein
MKLRSLLFLSLFAASLCAGAVLADSPPTVTVAPVSVGVTIRTVVLTYRDRAPDTTIARTRQLVVDIPNSIVYKNTYLRYFVGHYISIFNMEVARVADQFTAYKEGPFWKDNVALYKAERLKPFRDMDAVAPADSVPKTTYDIVHAENESTGANNAAEIIARKHVHDLLQKERK